MKLGFTGRVARTAAARPWITITVWLVALAAAIAASGGLASALSQDDHNLVTTESDKAQQIADDLQAAGTPEPRTETIVITSDSATFGDPNFAAAIDAAESALSDVAGVASVTGPTAAAPQPVSADGTRALVTVTLDANAPDTVGADILAALDGAAPGGYEYLAFGEETGSATFDGLAEDTLMRGEAIGIGVAVVILVVVFGALMAAGIPLLVALVSITTAVGATAIIGQAFEMSFFIVNMITMMGLALGIDYSLVMVQRFREELAKGRSTTDAVAVAGNTANRAVFFSGVTVIISLLGLLLVPSTIMRSLGAGAIIVACVSVLAALTLLPAVLRLLGHRVNKGRVPTAHPGREPRTWTAIARGVTGKPLLALTAGLILLVGLALPALSMRLTFPGLDALPADNDFRRAAEILVDDFGFGQSTTFVAIPGASGARDQIDSLAGTIDASPAFADTRVEWFGTDATIVTSDVYDGADQRAEDAVVTMREDWIPAALDGTGVEAFVGGGQAGGMDFTGIVADATPWVLLTVLGSSFLLLLVSFRSVVIPLTAIALNVLSAAAAFGVLVAVFQWGWGADLLGMPQVDGIAPWLPLFLFAVLFGLSMDYHVFLLSRIKERHDAGDNTRTSIVAGLSRTGSLITGAALIMVAVFGGFALGDMAEFSQMGLGLGVAVIIDATLVRTVLVPSIMTLLGHANWYLPRWMQWLPQMRIEAPEQDSAVAPSRAPELVH